MGGASGSLWLTGLGVEYYESRKRPIPQVQIGAIFEGPIEGSQIQAFASAINSSVQQVVENTDPDDLLDAILSGLNDMVQAVKGELKNDELATYSDAAKEFRVEVVKDNPDKTILHRLLSILSFLGDLEGTVELGERAFRLAERVMPYVPVLIGYLNQLE